MIAPGATVIYAEASYAYSASAFPFEFGPSGIRSLVPFDVLVEDEASTAFLPLANVELTPAGRQTQHCTTDGVHPERPCRFWVDLNDPTFDGSGLTQATVVASKIGFTTAQRVVQPRYVVSGPDCQGCSPDSVVLRLRRTP
jgi:hypothetical protein